MEADAFASADLVALVRRVFVPRPDDTGIGMLIDLPDAVAPDQPAWRARRVMAAEWVTRLAAAQTTLRLPTRLLLYRNAHTNNGELPADGAWIHGGGPLPETAEALEAVPRVPWAEVFTRHSILFAPTQFSATAPLKVAARTFAIRAATMPGFRAEMIPALRLDYTEINRRVVALAALLTSAEGADLLFTTPDGEAFLHLDLRHRTGHASGGLLPEPGTAGNLPSGEAYIVPYEGERAGDPSRTAGVLPVEFHGEVVRYTVVGNRAVAVVPGGPQAAAEAECLRAEPAYGNIAELGLGVLAAFGVTPIGTGLLDEKLGLHIAFGRSDHFGGQVGPGAFSSHDAVVHIDRIYVPACQPLVSVARAELVFAGGDRRTIIEANDYVPGLFA
ncbi:MAG: hypothetical protein P3A30_06075 [Gemmatimonadota bacterium]|nr:hypothetical protein [Gemmatimonadota bacterium]